MSLASVLQATKEILVSQADFPLSGKEMEILPDLRPPPYCGDRFLAIVGDDWSAVPDDDQHRGLCEQFGVVLCLTFRTSSLTYASTGQTAYIESASAMEPIIRRIIASLHQNVDLLTRANRLLPSSAPLLTYLRWKGCDPRPTIRGPDWFWSDTIKPNNVGLSWNVSFGNAVRYQTIDNIR